MAAIGVVTAIGIVAVIAVVIAAIIVIGVVMVVGCSSTCLVVRFDQFPNKLAILVGIDRTLAVMKMHHGHVESDSLEHGQRW